jgi:hypothetical protein
MPKEWVLNGAINRWGLQKKKNVGAVIEAIRICSPKSVSDWEDYYYTNMYSKEHLVQIGKKLYIKITEVLQAEIADVSEDDCVNYVINLVINRTFDGYNTEIKTIYGQLEGLLDCKIQPAPDEWDRLFNVDFSIEIKGKYIGIQIKPAGYDYITEMIKEKENQKKTHEKFERKFGGKVFYVFSVKDGDKKKIYNPEIIDEIKKEINRLNK